MKSKVFIKEKETSLPDVLDYKRINEFKMWVNKCVVKEEI